MRELGRSMAWHYTSDGPKKQIRMFVVGFLSTGRGKLPAVVVKFYDRHITQAARICDHYIGKAGNGAEMYWVNIKLGAQGDGSNDDEEVNRLVMGKMIAREVELNKQAYIAESRRIIAAHDQGSTVAPAVHVARESYSGGDDAPIDHDDDYRSDLSDSESADGDTNGRGSDSAAVVSEDQVSGKILHFSSLSGGKIVPAESGFTSG